MTMIHMIGKRFFVDRQSKLFWMDGRPHLRLSSTSARRTRPTVAMRIQAFLGRIVLPKPYRSVVGGASRG